MPLPRRYLYAVPIAAVVIAGCGGSDSPSATDQAAREKTPLSEAEYQALLDRGSDAVKDALTETKSAGSAATLIKRMEASASELADVSDELQEATVPAALQSVHAETVTGLTDLSTAFTSTAGAVESGEFCTAPAALAELTRSSAARDLRAAAKELRSGGVEASGLSPRAQRTPAVKLKNGMVLARDGGTGVGELEIRNGGSRDGVVKLVAGGKRTTVHIRRKSSATIKQIPDGSYRVFFASGASWDGRRNTFSRDCGFTAFDDKLKFTSGGGRYTRYTITLNPVAGGNAPSSPVDPADFPRD